MDYPTKRLKSLEDVISVCAFRKDDGLIDIFAKPEGLGLGPDIHAGTLPQCIEQWPGYGGMSYQKIKWNDSHTYLPGQG